MVCPEEEDWWMEYFRVSSPRHSASRREEVPSMGAHSRSTGGKICLCR